MVKKVAAVIACAFLLGGCAASGEYSKTHSPLLNMAGVEKNAPEVSSNDGKHLSKDFGRSYRAMFSTQVINPDAPEDKTPVDGYPGDIAEKIYEKYKTFEDHLTGGKNK